MSQPLLSSQAQVSLTPVAPEERVVLIDALRGVALLGILIMNMPAFDMPWEEAVLEPRLFPSTLDRAVAFGMDMFVSGKANSMFSFLFGLGLTIQMRRAETRGGTVVPTYLRRIGFLFLIGALHGIFVWNGDVLHTYAVLGLFLLAIRRVSDKVVSLLIAALFAAPMVRHLVSVIRHEPWVPPLEVLVARAHEHLRIFQRGTYLEQLGVRLETYKEIYYVLPQHGWGAIWWYTTLGVTILLGFYAGRKRLLENIETNPWIRKATWWCLGLGFSMAIGYAAIGLFFRPGQNNLTNVALQALYTLNRPVLCLAYIGLMAMAFSHARIRRFFGPFVNAGRMPLTNYLMQSLIATTLFNSYGFALYGKVGPALGLIFVGAIFSVQLAYSQFWMARFHYGPVEWIWRGVAYGKFPALRKAPHAAAPSEASSLR